MRVLIAYDTKYGNTKKVAELITEGIKSVEGNEVTLNHVKDIDLSKDEAYDLLIIGSPNHIGSHTKSVKKFVNKLSKAPIKVNSFAVFDTYMAKDFEKAAKKLEKLIKEKMPDVNKASSGLSIKVDGMKGPINEEDLPKCKEFGIKLGK
jgi:menaquinone-dependent protoporphyrinogen IX oxidase